MEKEKEKSKSRQATRLATLLLDSSLIFQSNKREYDCKIIECGDYVQLYKFSRKKLVDKNLELLEDKKKIKFDEDNLFKKENYSRRNEVGYIEYKNIIRSRNQLQRLIKANEHIWKTFITLTFEGEKAKDINYANKKFNIWRTYIKQLKKDFACAGVPEYQKRGVIHYHLLTNINYNDFSILSQQERKIWNKQSGWQIGRDVKGWSYGINQAKDIKGIDNIVTYLSKYMTKEFDNRLYSHKKYFYTRNLKQPKEYNLDFSNLKHYEYFEKIMKAKELQYNSSYFDYYGDEVNFFEFKGSQHNMYYTKTLFYTKYGFYSI